MKETVSPPLSVLCYKEKGCAERLCKMVFRVITVAHMRRGANHGINDGNMRRGARIAITEIHDKLIQAQEELEKLNSMRNLFMQQFFI